MSLNLLKSIGPNLPFGVSKSAMMSNKNEDGVILIGGWNIQTGTVSNSLLELKINSDSWKRLDDTLRFGRQYPLALSIPLQLAKCSKYKDKF